MAGRSGWYGSPKEFMSGKWKIFYDIKTQIG